MFLLDSYLYSQGMYSFVLFSAQRTFKLVDILRHIDSEAIIPCISFAVFKNFRPHFILVKENKTISFHYLFTDFASHFLQFSTNFSIVGMVSMDILKSSFEVMSASLIDAHLMQTVE